MENIRTHIRKINISKIAPNKITLILIIICGLLFCNNAKAMNISTEVRPTGQRWWAKELRCIYTDGTVEDRAYPNCKLYNTKQLRQIAMRVPTINFKRSHFYQFYFGIQNINAGEATELLWTPDTPWIFTLISMKNITDTRSFGIDPTTNLMIQGKMSQIQEIIVQVMDNVDNGWLIFGSDDGGTLVQTQTLMPGQQTAHTGYIWLGQVSEYEGYNGMYEGMTNAQQDNTDKVEEASQEGEDNANNATSDNEQASQNVLGVMNEVIGAFSTNATNCTIPMDLGNLNLGNVNLCSGKPNGITNLINIGGSIIIVYACYRVARNIMRLWLAMSVFAQGKAGNNG